MNKNLQFYKLFPWLLKGSMAILDQALFAGSNFVVNVLLARELSPTNFGIFTLGFSVFMFAAIVYNSFLIEPLAVFGASIFSSKLSEYWVNVEKLHLFVSCFLVIIFGFISLVNSLLGHYFWALTMGGIALSTPFIFYSWLMRRYCYVIDKPQYISQGAIVYCLMLFLGFGIFLQSGLLNSFTAFASMGFSAAISSFYLRSKTTEKMGKLVEVQFFNVVKQHWKYGKWSVVANFVRWLPSNIPFILLGTFKGGLVVAASLKASYNLILPISNVSMALSNYLIPSFSRSYRDCSKVRDNSLEYKALGIYALLSSTNAFVVIFFGKYLTQFLYQGRYNFSSIELIALALIPVIGSLTGVLYASFQALRKAKLIILPTVVSTITVTLGCVIFMHSLGLIGMLLSIFFAESMAFFVAYKTWLSTKKSIVLSMQ